MAGQGHENYEISYLFSLIKRGPESETEMIDRNRETGDSDNAGSDDQEQQTRGIDHCIPDDGVMLGQRRRQWANINTELGQYLVFAVKLLYH